MVWEIKFARKAEKELARLSSRHQKRVLAALPVIAEDPFIGKKLEGKLAGIYSYRVWPYRIIYKPYRKFLIVIIVRIGHRQGIY